MCHSVKKCVTVYGHCFVVKLLHWHAVCVCARVCVRTFGVCVALCVGGVLVRVRLGEWRLCGGCAAVVQAPTCIESHIHMHIIHTYIHIMHTCM